MLGQKIQDHFPRTLSQSLKVKREAQITLYRFRYNSLYYHIFLSIFALRKDAGLDVLHIIYLEYWMNKVNKAWWLTQNILGAWRIISVSKSKEKQRILIQDFTYLPQVFRLDSWSDSSGLKKGILFSEGPQYCWININFYQISPKTEHFNFNIKYIHEN